MKFSIFNAEKILSILHGQVFVMRANGGLPCYTTYNRQLVQNPTHYFGGCQLLLNEFEKKEKSSSPLLYKSLV